MLTGEVKRTLDPSEVYYELIDRTWSMNALTSAGFSEPLTADQAEAAWNRLAEQVPVIGARIERTSGREAHMVFGTPHGRLPIGRYDDLPTAWAQESRIPFDVADGPIVRCALVQEDAGASVLFVSHHSALDGRSLSELAMLFAKVALDGADVTDHPLAAPTVSLEGGGARTAGELSAAVATARQMRDEDSYVGAAGDVGWHDVRLDSPRDVAFTLFDLTEDETSGLIGWARSQQATVHGALSAAVIGAAATVAPELTRVGLSASVDLRSRFDVPEAGSIGMAAGVISAAYETTETSGATARLVTEDIRRRFDRGEGELLYALSGAGRFPVDDSADRVIKGWTEQATPTVFLGNVGVITGPAPPALLRVTPGLAPLPNQVAYVACATFRNRLSISVGCDRNRLTIAPDAFAAAVRSQVLELARAVERSDATR